MAFSFCGKRIILNRWNILYNSKRNNGYIVLVPEIGEDSQNKNPLIREDGLPEFNNITIEKCVAAIGVQTNDFEKGIRSIENLLSEEKELTDNVFENIFDPIETLGVPLETTWGLAKTMYLGHSTLMPTKSYLTIHDRARKARSAKFNSLPIYNALKNIKSNKKFNDEENRIIDKYILEGKLNGLDLGQNARLKFETVVQNLAKECNSFRDKIQIATKRFSHKINDFNTVRDFPLDLLKLMAPDSTRAHQGPWKATLQPHIYGPFMEYCPDRNIRWNLWQADVSRGSGYSDKNLETSTNIEKIRSLRRDQAKLLGYETYANLSMETKMAGTIDNVRTALQNLLEHARPAQNKELQSLQEFSDSRGFDAPLQFYDIPYWKRKQQRAILQMDDDKLKEYFPLPRVLSGLYTLCENLFNIKIQYHSGVDTWHDDVKYFDVFDGNGSRPIGGFYLDPYSRNTHKIRLTEDSGYMVGIRNRSDITDTLPLTSLIFNFEAPSTESPSLLKLKDVHLLFTKLGYALQHLLTRAHYSEVSGSSNIEWDAVYVCGNVMSQFLYDRETLSNISGHYITGECLSSQHIDGIEQIKTHTAGLDLCRELYLASLDLELHTSKEFWLDVVKRLWLQFHNLSLDKQDSHPCNFSAIFCEQWGAAYFSHVWSKLVAADVFGAFYEAKGNQQQMLDTGKRFKDTFLALGGACKPNEVFRRFRGRDPSPKALLKSLGLKKLQTVEEKLHDIVT